MIVSISLHKIFKKISQQVTIHSAMINLMLELRTLTRLLIIKLGAIFNYNLAIDIFEIQSVFVSGLSASKFV